MNGISNPQQGPEAQSPDKPPRCPVCGSDQVVPIVYGLPSWELGQAAERGEIVLGGCIITDHAPKWHCLDCGHTWR